MKYNEHCVIGRLSRRIVWGPVYGAFCGSIIRDRPSLLFCFVHRGHTMKILLCALFLVAIANPVILIPMFIIWVLWVGICHPEFLEPMGGHDDE